MAHCGDIMTISTQIPRPLPLPPTPKDSVELERIWRRLLACEEDYVADMGTLSVLILRPLMAEADYDDVYAASEPNIHSHAHAYIRSQVIGRPLASRRCVRSCFEDVEQLLFLHRGFLKELLQFER